MSLRASKTGPFKFHRTIKTQEKSSLLLKHFSVSKQDVIIILVFRGRVNTLVSSRSGKNLQDAEGLS